MKIVIISIFFMIFIISCNKDSKITPIIEQKNIYSEEILKRDSEYPKLFFSKNEIQSLRDRVDDDFYKKIITESKKSLPNSITANPYDGVTVLYSSRTIKNIAFRVLIEQDSELINPIIDYFQILPDDLSTSSDSHNILHVSEALVSFAQSYDFLAGSGLLDENQLLMIKTKILNITNSLFDLYATDKTLNYLQLLLTHNNWNIKFASAMGLIALTFPKEDNSFFYLSYGVTEIYHYLMEALTTEEGGYSEGPNYHKYSQSEYIPFLIAWSREINGFDYGLYPQYCLTRRTKGCETGVSIEISDFTKSERFKKIVDWNILLTMPDGFTPPFDDNVISCNDSAPFLAFFKDPLYIWSLTNFKNCLMTVGNHSIESFVFFDKSIASQKPNDKNYISYKTGLAIFRSGWSENDTFMMMNGEHSPIRGESHEHADETSITLHAFGETLISDSGYIKYSERDKVNKEKNHSLILIDNLGPTNPSNLSIGGSDAWIIEEYQSDNLSFVKVETKYQNHKIQRYLISWRNRYFFTLDTPKAMLYPEKERTYAHTIQLLGGEDERGVVELFNNSKSVTLTKNSAKLKLSVWSNFILELSLDRQCDGIKYGDERYHKRFLATGKGVEPTFFTFYNPETIDNQFVTIIESSDLITLPFATIDKKNGYSINFESGDELHFQKNNLLIDNTNISFEIPTTYIINKSTKELTIFSDKNIQNISNWDIKKGKINKSGL